MTDICLISDSDIVRAKPFVWKLSEHSCLQPRTLLWPNTPTSVYGKNKDRIWGYTMENKQMYMCIWVWFSSFATLQGNEAYIIPTISTTIYRTVGICLFADVFFFFTFFCMSRRWTIYFFVQKDSPENICTVHGQSEKSLPQGSNMDQAWWKHGVDLEMQSTDLIY